MKKHINAVIGNSLYKNSLYLMINAVVMALLGFVFWAIAARVLSAEDVGLGSTVIAAMSLIVNFSILGFNISLMRYMPKSKHKDKILSSSLALVGVTAFVVAAVFFLFIDFLVPALAFMKENLLFALGFVVLASFGAFFHVLEAGIIAERKSALVLVKNSVWSVLKIVFIMFLAFLGAWGLFFAWYISLAISVLLSAYFLRKHIRFVFDKKVLNKMLHFSFANYVGHFFFILPGIGFPLFITRFLGAEQTAYFYVSWMVASLLFFIPLSVSRSYLTEGSHEPKKSDLKKALQFTYIILLPSLAIGLLFSKFVLGLFGEEYFIGGWTLLIVLLLSSLFHSYNLILTSYYNLKDQVRYVIGIHFLVLLLTFVFSYVFLDYGLIAIGLSWLGSNILVSILLLFKKRE